MKSIETESLVVGYFEYGPATGWPVILSHGFPYDVHAYDVVAERLVEAGARVLTPYTRGFGGTRFLSDRTMRSGQQAARGLDIIQFANALALDRPILGGFDWGGNASCVAAALWPDRVGGLVSYAGYDIIDTSEQGRAAIPSLERTCWYQHLFQSERGRECLTKYRRELCRLLWKEWSPGWAHDDNAFELSASAFDNPDFVDVVIHWYRCMLGTEHGDPALQPLEDRLSEKPVIDVPTVTIDGTKDPLKPGGTAEHARFFGGWHRHLTVDSGHYLPAEKPEVFADAVIEVHHIASQ